MRFTMIRKSIYILLLLGLCTQSCKEDPKFMEIDGNINEWNVNPAQYQHFMSIVVKTNMSNDTLNVLGAFSGDNIRGFTKGELHNGKATYFLLVYSNEVNSRIGFRIYENSSGNIFGSSDSLDFQSGSGLGSPDNPYEIEF